MTEQAFVKVLKTTSSHVSKKSLYTGRFTYYVPDLFIVSLYLSLFVFSGVFDILFIFRILLYDKTHVSGIVFLLTVVISGLFEYVLECSNDNYIGGVSVHKCCRFFFTMLGFNALFNFTRACTEIFTAAGKRVTKPLRCFTYPFFQITDESLSAIKIHCLINSALKSLPRLFILPIIILNNNLKGISAFLGITVLMMNMVIFSLTMALTFPIRSTPRVFTSSICVLLNAFSKFMATMSSCGVILAIFATVFRSIRFYALLVPLLRCLTWGWPCWTALKTQSVPLTRFAFFVYFLLFTFFSSFIYIHPFEGVGKLHYYVFYLLDFLEEIMVIYLFTDVSLDSITGYFGFRVVMIGFLSTFGLVNILHKYKEENTEYGCVSYTNVTSEGFENDTHVEESQTVRVKEEVPKKDKSDTK